MRRMKTQVASIAALLVVFALCGAALAADKPAATKEVVWPGAGMRFMQVIPGVGKVVLWGDATNGAYAAITRFAKGQKNPLHTHSHDIKMVIISGTWLYDSGTGERRLGAGSYLLVPAGQKHTSGAGDDADCVFFEESDGPFELLPAK